MQFFVRPVRRNGKPSDPQRKKTKDPQITQITQILASKTIQSSGEKGPRFAGIEASSVGAAYAVASTSCQMSLLTELGAHFSMTQL
jgi:hypothetical protein